MTNTQYDNADDNSQYVHAKTFIAQKPADLVTFTEEILTGKLHFLCSDWWSYLYYFQMISIAGAPNKSQQMPCMISADQHEQAYKRSPEKCLWEKNLEKLPPRKLLFSHRKITPRKIPLRMKISSFPQKSISRQICSQVFFCCWHYLLVITFIHS